MKKRILSLLLSLIMVLSLLPTTAWAGPLDSPDGGNDNATDTGILSITKQIAGENPDTTAAFTFTVKLRESRFLYSSPVSGTFGEYTFTNGKTTFSLKHNATVPISDIPAGTYYTVEETSSGSYAASYTNSGEGTISKNTISRVTVTNTWKVTTYSINHVDIAKDDNATALGVPSSATVVVTYADNSTKTLSRTGTSTGGSGEAQWRFTGLKSSSYIGNGNKSDDLTGAKRVVSVYVSYVVNGQTYEYTLDDYDGLYAGFKNCPGHEGLDIAVLGSATVDYYFYKVVYEYYTNDTLDGTDNDGAVQQVTDTSVTLSPDATRSYDSNSYTFDSTMSVDYTNVDLTASKNSPTNPIVINLVYKRTLVTTGSLTIHKTNTGDYTPASVTFTVTGPNGYSNTVTLNAANSWTTTLNSLTPGEYTVTENTEAATPNGYTLSATGNGVVKATVTAGGTATANITNTYTKNTSTTTNLATLTVTKTGINADGSYVNGTKESSVLAGVTFTLTSASGTAITKTTGANGVAVFDNLDEGTYTLSETAPDGYTAAAAQQITVVKTKTTDNVLDGNVYKTVYTCTINDASNYALEVKNTQITKNITVTKSWNNTDEGYTAPEATSVTVKLMNGTTEVTSTVLTAAGNWTYTFTGLPTHDNSGKEIAYTVVEADVPGYQQDGNVATNNDGSLTITNKPKWADDTTVTKATLTVVKVDEDDTSKKLAGATFTLYNADKTEVVGAAQTTTSSGTITFTGLTEGTYTLVETTPPDGYKAAADKTITIGAGTKTVDPIYDTDGTTVIGYKKHITYANANATITNIMNVEQTNRVEPATLTIKKVDSADSNKLLTGAKFQLTNGTTTLYSTDNNDGTYTITGINADGSWTLTEVAAPTGYDKGTWSKTINAKHTTSEPTLDKKNDIYYCTDVYVIEKSNDYDPADNVLVIGNTRSTKSIAPTKEWKDVEGITLPVSITVELYANNAGTGKRVVLTPPAEGDVWTSTEKFTDLPTHDENGQPITYTVKEVGYTVKVNGTSVYTEKALDGFTPTGGDNANNYKITNTANWNETRDVNNPASLTIKKVDSVDKTKPLHDAKFTLYNDKVVYKTATSDVNGVATFTDLKPGTYTLKETDAPDGYKETSQEWQVEIKRDENSRKTEPAADGTFQNIYDCTVTVSEVKGNEYAPLTADNGSYTITNELAPTEYTAKVDIEKIVEKTGGNVAPSDANFTFVAMCDGVEKNVGTETIKTTGVGTYTGKLTLTVPASAFKLNDNGDGFVKLTVKEIAGSLTGWTYDDTVYKLAMTVKNYVVTGISIYEEAVVASVTDEQIPGGQETNDDSAAVTLSFTNGFSQTTPPSRPNKPGKPSKPITSVKTGDAGVAMYAMSGLLSLGGAALFMKKRKDEE